jgi:tetratricopeptide (TPR) repeat protein
MPRRSLPIALACFKTACAVHRGAWQLYCQLAIAQFGLKQYSEAEQQYLKVQPLNPNAPADLRVKLADVYLREGAYDKAYQNQSLAQ